MLRIIVGSLMIVGALDRDQYDPALMVLGILAGGLILLWGLSKYFERTE